MRALREDEVDVAAAVLSQAFAEEPSLRWLLPDEAARHQLAPVLAAALCRYHLRAGVVWCTEDVSGVALRRPPGRSGLSMWAAIEAGLVWVPLQLGWSASERLVEATLQADARHERAVSGPHWYLSNLAVRPDRQGEGLGGALMAHTFANADADGLPCFLETTHPRALAIHRAHGFQVVEEAVLPGSQVGVWAMVRPPGGR